MLYSFMWTVRKYYGHALTARLSCRTGQLKSQDRGAASTLGRARAPRSWEPAPSLRLSVARALSPVSLPAKQDERVSFSGANNFRLLGEGQRRGAPTRALAERWPHLWIP